MMEILVMPEVKKRFYSTIEISDMLGVEASCIRYWSKVFNVQHDSRSKEGGARGTRFYSRENVAVFHHVHNLLHIQKFTIEGAKIKLRSLKLI